MSRLDGRVAIVTGAGRGIGRAIATRLAADGVRLVLNDLDSKPLAETAAALGEAGTEVETFAGDIAAAVTGDALVAAALDRFGGLDVVVNNAGYIWNSAAVNHSDEQWQAMLDVHATGPFRLLRAAGRYFRDCSKRGETGHTRKIVNVSSVSGVYGAATQAGYSAAKAAVIGMTRTLAREWGRYNVTVNCVAFGYIDTRLTARFDARPGSIAVDGREHPVGLSEAQVEQVQAATALGRLGTPEDAANAVWLLCVPESDFITGEVLMASGGFVG